MNIKNILVGAFLALFVAVPLARAATIFENNLYYGITGSDEVIRLQEFLTEQGVYTGPITGNFYSLTKKAVIAFQVAHGINGSGYFGPLTKTKANQLLGQVMEESGTPVATPSNPSSTANGFIASLSAQIANLQEQLNVMRAQQTAIQQQILPRAIQIRKELVIDTCEPRIHVTLGQICESTVYYLENGERKDAEITFTSDDSGSLICNSCADQNTRANPLTARTRINDRDGKPWLRLLYIPSATGLRRITGTANGVSASITAPGHLEISTPTEMKVYTHDGGYFLGDPRFAGIGMVGSKCDNMSWFAVAILDQYGKEMANQEVTLTTPAGSITKTLTERDFFLQSYLNTGFQGQRFYYRPGTKNTTETLTFISGNLTASTNVYIRDPGLESHIVLREDGTWVEPSSGQQVNPITMTCITNHPVLE